MKDSAPGVGVELSEVQPGESYAVTVHGTILGGDSVRVTGLISFFDQEREVDVGFHDYSGPKPVDLGLGDLPATWGLVVGIDPASEDALIGLSRYVNGGYLTTGTYEQFDPQFNRNALAIPILTASRSPIPGDLTVSISKVAGLSPDQLQAFFDANGHKEPADQQRAIAQLVSGLTLSPVASDTAHLQDLFRPLRLGGVFFGPDGHLVATPENRGGGAAASDDVVLVPSLASYIVSTTGSSDLALSSKGSWQDVIGPKLAALRPSNWIAPEANFGGDATVYRDLQATVPRPFVLAPVGSYDREAIDAQFAGAANYSPLGIYATVPRTLIKDTTGQPVHEAVPLSINPSGINPQPPLGLTNLEAVEAIRGDHFIDAIRVRVGGLSDYSAQGQEHLRAIAQQIVDLTGLRVDVIAGSSPIDVTVAVPDHGVMTERWTTLGTAAEIVSGAAGVSAVLLAATLGVVIAYLAAFGSFLTGDQDREFRILRRLGWRRRAIVTLVSMQALGLGLLSAFLTVLLVTLLAFAGRRPQDGGALALTAIAVVAAHPLAAALLSVSRSRSGTASRQGFKRPRRTSGGLASIAWALASETPGRVVTVGFACVLALTTAGIVAAVELAAGGTLQATIFGAAISLRLAAYHFLAVAAALFGAGALVLDGALLTVERRLPLIGTLRSVGWRTGPIRRLVLLETGIPAFGAGALAATLVAGTGFALGLGLASLALAAGVLLCAIALVFVATELPARIAMAAPPALALRAEGASGTVGGFAPRQALLTVGALILTVSVVAMGWSAAEAAAPSVPPFVQPTEHPISATAQQLIADATAIATHGDRLAGSAAFKDAAEYVRNALTQSGYTVEIAQYLSPIAQFRSRDGTEIHIDGLQPEAIAYDAAMWTGGDLELTPEFLDVRDGRVPSACPLNIAVLRIANSRQAGIAAETQSRCTGRAHAIVTVRIDSDAAWTTLGQRTSHIQLTSLEYLIATNAAAAGTSDVPWLVTTLDGAGPGATATAAPMAVVLEVARRLSADGRALRIGVTPAANNAAGSVFLSRLVSQSHGPIVWLGPMGGPVAAVLGTIDAPAADPVDVTAGLLWISAVDSSYGTFSARAHAPATGGTSERLLSSLSAATGILPSTEASLNLPALSLGLDAAWLGEPLTPKVGPASIAGTPADTPEQLHPLDLEQLTIGLTKAIEELK